MKSKTRKRIVQLALFVFCGLVLIGVIKIINSIDLMFSPPQHVHRNAHAIEGGLGVPFIPVVDKTLSGGKMINAFKICICQDCGVLYVEEVKVKTITQIIEGN